MERLDQALLDNSAVEVKVFSRHGKPESAGPKRQPQAEPQLLQPLDDEAACPWGRPDPLVVLKASNTLAELANELTSIASRTTTNRDRVDRRLLRCLIALGKSMGIEVIVSTKEAGETEDGLVPYAGTLAAATTSGGRSPRLGNVAFKASDPHWWGSSIASSSRGRSACGDRA